MLRITSSKYRLEERRRGGEEESYLLKYLYIEVAFLE